MENKENFYCVYPIHIDSSTPLSGGRRYSKDNAVEKPTMKEIKNALEACGIQHIVEADKRHPQDLREKGRFRIAKSFKRKETIKKVIDFIKELRLKKNTASDVKAANNFLNLKPKSKKKK